MKNLVFGIIKHVGRRVLQKSLNGTVIAVVDRITKRIVHDLTFNADKLKQCMLDQYIGYVIKEAVINEIGEIFCCNVEGILRRFGELGKLFNEVVERLTRRVAENSVYVDGCYRLILTPNILKGIGEEIKRVVVSFMMRTGVR